MIFNDCKNSIFSVLVLRTIYAADSSLVWCAVLLCRFLSMMASSIVYDVAVIGAGVIGSAAACQIAKNGSKVILLEQVSYVEGV